MRLFALTAILLIGGNSFAQNHSNKPIRFIFESIHDHLGNLDINSKKVMLFGTDNQLVYEADLLEGEELDETFYYYNKDRKLNRLHRNYHQPHESGDFKMTYDSKGNLIQEVNYDDRGKAIEKITMTYNDKGQKITEQLEFYHQSTDGMIVESFFKFTYGDDGKLASKVGFEGEHEERTVTYKYFHTDDSETIKEYNMRNDLIEKWVTTYNDKGWMMQKSNSKYDNGIENKMTIDFTYDEHGHILTETFSKSGSSLKKVVTFDYVYDDHGNWIEKKESIKKGAKEMQGNSYKRSIEYYEHDDYGHHPMELDESFTWENHDGKKVKVLQESHVRINNNEGKIEWVVRRNGPDLFQVDEYEYENGKLVKVHHLNHEGGKNAYTTYTYNDSGKLIEEASFSASGKKDESFTYEYDSNGRLTKKVEKSTGMSQGELTTVLSAGYKYDGSGNMVKVSIIELDLKYTIDYVFDDNGVLIQKVESPISKGANFTKTEYSYERGKLVSELQYEGKAKAKGSITSYEYNSLGEVIKQTVTHDGAVHSEVDYIYLK